MTNDTDNKALDKRYADRFLAFITSTDENQRQDEVFSTLVKGLRKHDALPNHVNFLDLGCGPGEMTKSFYNHFSGSVHLGRSARAFGVELNEDHIKAARSKGITVMPQDIFEEGMFSKLMFSDYPDAVMVSHSAYYGPKPRVPTGNQAEAPQLDQPTLATLVHNVKDAMGENTIAFFQHKSTEPTNFLKRPHGAVVESDINRSLDKYCLEEGLKIYPITFKCKLTLPKIPEGLWEELQNPPTYPQTEFGETGKRVRDVLEFLAHRGLEEMSEGERHLYLSRASMLVERDAEKGGIDTYVDMKVALRDDAPKALHEKVKAAVEETKKKQGLSATARVA